MWKSWLKKYGHYHSFYQSLVRDKTLITNISGVLNEQAACFKVSESPSSEDDIIADIYPALLTTPT